MTLSTSKTLLVSLAIIVCGFAFQPRAKSAPALPNPVLYLTQTETIQSNGKTFIRYRYDVFNKDQYPAEMFAASPELPPCGKNAKASRTWVDFYDQRGTRIGGFCALTKPSDLGSIWFSFEEGQIPPSWVYIEMKDRKTNTIYKSNLAETSM